MSPFLYKCHCRFLFLVSFFLTSFILFYNHSYYSSYFLLLLTKDSLSHPVRKGAVKINDYPKWISYCIVIKAGGQSEGCSMYGLLCTAFHTWDMGLKQGLSSIWGNIIIIIIPEFWGWIPQPLTCFPKVSQDCSTARGWINTMMMARAASQLRLIIPVKCWHPHKHPPMPQKTPESVCLQTMWWMLNNRD